MILPFMILPLNRGLSTLRDLSKKRSQAPPSAVEGGGKGNVIGFGDNAFQPVKRDLRPLHVPPAAESGVAL